MSAGKARSPGWIEAALGLLPAGLKARLDAWSHGVARRHAREREQAWLRRQARSGRPG